MLYKCIVFEFVLKFNKNYNHYVLLFIVTRYVNVVYQQNCIRIKADHVIWIILSFSAFSLSHISKFPAIFAFIMCKLARFSWILPDFGSQKCDINPSFYRINWNLHSLTQYQIAITAKLVLSGFFSCINQHVTPA